MYKMGFLLVKKYLFIYNHNKLHEFTIPITLNLRHM